MNNVMCVKWGNLYGPEYVNVLYAMVKRNLTEPFRFICLTDSAKGIRSEVDVIPLPTKQLDGWWSKLAFFQSPLADIEGPCLTFDLDMVIVDNIDCFFQHEPNEFCMKWDYQTGKKIDHGHSSCVMRFEANKYPHIYDKFDLKSNDCGIHNTQSGFKQHKYWGDQVWITEHADNVKNWPKSWIIKFSRDCHRDPKTKEPIGERSVKQIGLHTQEFFVPEGSKVIAFSGKKLRNENELDKIGKWWNDA